MEFVAGLVIGVTVSVLAGALLLMWYLSKMWSR